MKRIGRPEMQWGAKKTCRTLPGREKLHVERDRRQTHYHTEGKTAGKDKFP